LSDEFNSVVKNDLKIVDEENTENFDHELLKQFGVNSKVFELSIQ
jgi:hypothetical protein